MNTYTPTTQSNAGWPSKILRHQNCEDGTSLKCLHSADAAATDDDDDDSLKKNENDKNLRWQLLTFWRRNYFFNFSTLCI